MTTTAADGMHVRSISAIDGLSLGSAHSPYLIWPRPKRAVKHSPWLSRDHIDFDLPALG